MITSDTLSKVFVLAGKIDALVKGASTVTLENAFTHPDVLGLRDALLAALSDDHGVDALIEASAALNDEFERLHALPYSDENVVKMGVIIGTATALSSQAAKQAAEPIEIFKYSVGKLWPYLEQLARIGVLVVGAAV